VGCWWPIWAPFILSNGGQIVDEDGNFAMNSSASTDAIPEAGRPGDCRSLHAHATAKEGMPSEDVALLTGTYAMVIGGHGSAMTFADPVSISAWARCRRWRRRGFRLHERHERHHEGFPREEAAWTLLTYLNDPSIDLTTVYTAATACPPATSG
jgi:hypothetical protein